MIKSFCVVQAECDELAQRADVLNGENASLRAEINKLKSQYEELLAENSSLKVLSYSRNNLHLCVPVSHFHNRLI